TNQVTNISSTIGGNTYVDANGGLTPAGQQALVTYDVAGQTATGNTNVIAAIKNMNESGIKFFHTNDGTNGQATGGVMATGTNDSSASGKYATAVGYEASATAQNALAIGRGAVASGANSISIGTGNVVSGNNSGAIGDPSIVNADGSYSIGNNNTVAVGSNDAFIVGNNITQTAANSVNLGSKSAATVAATAQTAGMTDYSSGVVNGNQLQFAAGTPAGVVTVGSAGQERRIQNVAAGLVSATSTDAVNGSQLYSVANAVNALAVGGVQYAANPDGTVNYNQVQLQGVPYDPQTGQGGTTISNVAPGVRPGDAVNVQQLNRAVGGLAGRIETVDKNANAGTASAMAMAGLPQAYLPGKSMFAVGAGTYRGQGAMAMGLSMVSDNGKWVIKGSLSSNTRGHVGASVGAGYQW
ncbi:MAG: YadA-like family protein, partial [Brachymonas sp.]|nr:YadA-like family protein [Brachymonas sp.]